MDPCALSCLGDYCVILLLEESLFLLFLSGGLPVAGVPVCLIDCCDLSKLSLMYEVFMIGWLSTNSLFVG